MFEYLMPLLVMPTYDEHAARPDLPRGGRAADRVRPQRGVPWGISESGYNTIDAQLNYQYRAFGVPGLGLKRGLADDLVIAPYASALALMVAPEAACANLQRLAADGLRGRLRLLRGDRLHAVAPAARADAASIVRSFMAHHQGMSLLSLAYLLLDRPMQRRFESDPLFQATAAAAAGARAARRAPFYPHTAERRRRARASPDAPRRRCACSPTPTRRRPRCSCCPTAATT